MADTTVESSETAAMSPPQEASEVPEVEDAAVSEVAADTSAPNTEDVTEEEAPLTEENDGEVEIALAATATASAAAAGAQIRKRLSGLMKPDSAGVLAKPISVGAKGVWRLGSTGLPNVSSTTSCFRPMTARRLSPGPGARRSLAAPWMPLPAAARWRNAISPADVTDWPANQSAAGVLSLKRQNSEMPQRQHSGLRALHR